MNTFTNNELLLISNALLLAIQNNNEAAKLTVSEKVVEEIGRSSKELQALNSKVCAFVDSEQNSDTEILIEVNGGAVQSVYTNANPPVSVTVCDRDSDVSEAEAAAFDARVNSGRYRRIW